MDAEIHRHTLGREGAEVGGLHWVFSLEAQEMPQKRERKNCGSQRGNLNPGTPGEDGLQS